jgi:hypothetical protein
MSRRSGRIWLICRWAHRQVDEKRIVPIAAVDWRKLRASGCGRARRNIDNRDNGRNVDMDVDVRRRTWGRASPWLRWGLSGARWRVWHRLSNRWPWWLRWLRRSAPAPNAHPLRPILDNPLLAFFLSRSRPAEYRGIACSDQMPGHLRGFTGDYLEMGRFAAGKYGPVAFSARPRIWVNRKRGEGRLNRHATWPRRGRGPGGRRRARAWRIEGRKIDVADTAIPLIAFDDVTGFVAFLNLIESRNFKADSGGPSVSLTH